MVVSFLSGLPTSGSWQDLKDHLREAGDVCYADVTKDGSGVAEFMRYEVKGGNKKMTLIDFSKICVEFFHFLSSGHEVRHQETG